MGTRAQVQRGRYLSLFFFLFLERAKFAKLDAPADSCAREGMAREADDSFEEEGGER